MVEYVSTSTINARPDVVWAILTDAVRYGEWNPEILAIDGRLAFGERIKARVRLGSGAMRTVPMRVTGFAAPSRMEWTGGLPLGLFVGRREFTVTASGPGSEFRLHLRMSGPLLSLILKSVGNRQPEVDSFAAALKQRAERR
jgi:hypothetical protein